MNNLVDTIAASIYEILKEKYPYVDVLLEGAGYAIINGNELPPCIRVAQAYTMFSFYFEEDRVLKYPYLYSTAIHS